MTRPANPSQTIPVHAPDVNYPAGANNWSSTPTKQPHPGSPSVGFTPDTGVPAQCVNKLFNDAFDMGSTLKSYDALVMNYLGQIPALNFDRAGIAATNFSQAKFKNGVWYLSSSNTNDRFARTTDLYTIGAISSEITGGGLVTAQKHSDFDVDNSGNIVIIDDAIDGFKHYNGSSWARVTGALSVDCDKPTIVWEPVSGLWCIVGTSAGTGPTKVWTSPDRTTWTLRTKPSGMPDGGHLTLGVNGLGRMVMVRHGLTNAVRFAYSDDGGITWSAATSDFALGFTPGAGGGGFYWPKPIWNGSYWLLAATVSTGGAGASKIFKSADGATWAEVDAQTDGVRWMAPLGDLWIGLVNTTKLAFSVGGEVWKLLPKTMPGNCETVWAGMGLFAAFDMTNDKLYPSLQTGIGADLVTL